MGRRTAVAGTAVAALVTIGAAPPATAAHPGQNGLITYVAEATFDVPCFGGVLDDPPTPLSVSAHGGIAWSPDGRQVAVEADGPGILVVEVETCAWRGLGPSAGSGLSWSPDGTRLAAVRDGDVVILDAVTGDLAGAVTRTPDVHEGQPSWSPTDDVIAYTGEGGIRVAPTDGSLPAGTLIVPGAGYPDHSPDGSRIVYAQGGDRFESALAHARAADGGDEVVVAPGRIRAWHVAWSPDGQKILFAGEVRDETGWWGDLDCHVTSLDGSEITRLGVQPAPCSRPAWQPLPREQVPDLTLVYVYRKVDPTRPPSWGNSGPQSLLSVSTGHAWLPRGGLTVADLPAGVCGPGWAVQTDWTVDLRPQDVPGTIDRATRTNVLGWKTVVQAARHHSLEYYVDVPACDAVPAPTG